MTCVAGPRPSERSGNRHGTPGLRGDIVLCVSRWIGWVTLLLADFMRPDWRNWAEGLASAGGLEVAASSLGREPG